MMVALLLSLLVSAAGGVLLLRLAWPGAAAPWRWPLALSLGTGLGAALSAGLFFAWMVAVGPTPGFPLAETGLLAVLVLAAARRALAGATGSALLTPTPVSRWFRLLAPAFAVVLLAASAAFVSSMMQHPHGEWDAWMNWSLKARMFFRGAEAWRDAFSAAIPWSHPDYPVLVPTLVARTWRYAGVETLAGPALVAAVFTFGTVALLGSALALLRSPSQGLVASIVLLSTPFFLIHGTSLYADVPLGFYFLATFVCLALDARYGAATRRFAVLAGVAAGLSMWTKNEGLLFTFAVGIGVVAAGGRAGWAASRPRMLALAAGLLPPLLLTAGYKIGFAPPNDLISTLGVERTLGNLMSPERYLITLRAYVSHIAGFGANGVGSAVWVLVAYLLAVGVSRTELSRSSARTGVAALVLLLAGHFAVFVTMAYELSRLLASSLDRLLLQLWPSALFLFFMVSRTLEETGDDREPAATAAPAPAD